MVMLNLFQHLLYIAFIILIIGDPETTLKQVPVKPTHKKGQGMVFSG
jgi:hypothetical protein